nr:hypothetical protein GCM10025732_47640 [Glycomyces mayteni]
MTDFHFGEKFAILSALSTYIDQKRTFADRCEPYHKQAAEALRKFADEADELLIRLRAEWTSK